MATGSDDQQCRPQVQGCRATANSGICDRDRCASTESGFLAVQVEHNLSFEDQVQLLLSTRPLVVLVNKRLASASRHEHIDSEGVDPERVLERIPGGIVWAAV